ncbi:MAG: class I SAM-dependent methyltransferase [Methanomicrobiaceae archaeon]|nr:class I SAM-dependent methyltransferase [Methanomicrobiaceae archaeon]
MKERICETDDGIQSAEIVSDFNLMQRSLRDKNLLSTNDIIKSGINFGCGLEIGPGPGYLGLEWLSKTLDTELFGLEISPAMISTARENSVEYGLSERVSYCCGNALDMPFSDNSLDFVFSNGSMHEWEDLKSVFSEIYRVLKPEGRFFISDLKRNISFFILFLMKITVNKKSLKEGLITSVNASYTKEEIAGILSGTDFKGDFFVSEDLFGLNISGKKSP